MKLIILTLFPDYFSSVFSVSIIKRAVHQNTVDIAVVNIRDFATDKHHITDDRPYGGGPGMVMMVEPIDRALQHCREQLVPKEVKPFVILTSAKGAQFTQQTAQDWSQLECLIIICGHYEGVDERVAQYFADAEIRIGNFVLTGGEPAAAVIVDAIVRLIPGVLGNENSTLNESHSVSGVLGIPQYTRPEEYKGMTVPSELLTGHHADIKSWRDNQRTKEVEALE